MESRKESYVNRKKAGEEDYANARCKMSALCMIWC
jgi:hypothetical protein